MTDPRPIKESTDAAGQPPKVAGQGTVHHLGVQADDITGASSLIGQCSEEPQ